MWKSGKEVRVHGSWPWTLDNVGLASLGKAVRGNYFLLVGRTIGSSHRATEGTEEEQFHAFNPLCPLCLREFKGLQGLSGVTH